MNWLNEYGLTLAIFIPTLGALAVIFVRAKELAKSIALVASILAFAAASYVTYEYARNPAAHPNVVEFFADHKLERLPPLERADRQAIEQELARGGSGARFRSNVELYRLYGELNEMRLASTVPIAQHLRFVEWHPWIRSFGINYFLAGDGLSIPLIWLTALLTVLCLIYSWNIDKLPRAFYALFLILETGLNGVFAALDLFLFYVFWEIVLLPMYFLIGIWGGPRRIYAAIKFFIYTLIGSVLMLIAFLYMYFQVEPHTFNLLALIGWVPDTAHVALTAQKWLFIALFIGFAIKVPVFPFHTWLPDAHVEAPTAASMVLAGILLKMGGYGFFRLMYPLCPEVSTSAGFIYFIALLGMINIVYGALVAMSQTDFKSLVAYSSISHMGYVLLGLVALNVAGFQGGVLQMFNHGISSAMLFCIVGVVYERAHHRNLADFGGIGLQMPYYTGVATVGFFASLGLPGLNGFISEALTFLGAYQPSSLIVAGSEGMPGIGARWIVYISLSGVVLAAAYILWTVQRVYLGPIQEKYLKFKDMNAREALSLVPLAALCVLIGVYPPPILNFMDPTLQAIIQTVRQGAMAQ